MPKNCPLDKIDLCWIGECGRYSNGRCRGLDGRYYPIEGILTGEERADWHNHRLARLEAASPIKSEDLSQVLKEIGLLGEDVVTLRKSVIPLLKKRTPKGDY